MPCQSRDGDAPRRVVGANAGSYSCTDILFALLFIANLVPICNTACQETYERRRLDWRANLSCGAWVAAGPRSGRPACQPGCFSPLPG